MLFSLSLLWIGFQAVHSLFSVSMELLHFVSQGDFKYRKTGARTLQKWYITMLYCTLSNNDEETNTSGKMKIRCQIYDGVIRGFSLKYEVPSVNGYFMKIIISPC